MLLSDAEGTKKLIQQMYGGVEDITSDPTLPATSETKCEKCGHFEAVFFQVRCLSNSYSCPSIGFSVTISWPRPYCCCHTAAASPPDPRATSNRQPQQTLPSSTDI